MFRSFVCMLLCLLCTSIAIAQRHRFGLASEYNIPLGKMAWSYKSAPGVQLSYSLLSGDRQVRRGITVSVGYTLFQPKADTLYFVADNGGVGGAGLGTAVYSPYKILQLSFFSDYEIKLSKKTFLFAAFGGAYYYGKREILIEDEFGASTGLSETGARVGLIPRAGVGFHLTENMRIVPYVSYNFLIEVGSTDPDAIDYNENSGAISHFITPALSANIRF